MKTEARFAIAILLMLLVLVGTNILFPPVVPEADLAADSAAAGAAAEVEAPPRPSPTIPETSPPPTVPPGPAGSESGTPAAASAVTERVVSVETPLYSIAFSTAGARMLSAELTEFPSLAHDGVVDLVPQGSMGMFGQRLVIGSDTIDLTSVPFQVEPEGGLRLSESSGPREIRFVYQHPTADFRFEVGYTFEPDRYMIGVRGQVSGVDQGLLLTSLGDGIAFAEADSTQEARLMGYVQNHVDNGIRATLVRNAEPTVVPGPLQWAAFKSKFFVVALLGGETDDGGDGTGLLGGLIVSDSELPERIRVATAETVRRDGRFAHRLFLGPQEYARLSSLGQGMEEVNPYGWRFFRPIIRPFVSIILTILSFLHTQLSIGYGWVLVLFGVLMRIVLFPLNHKAMRAQLRNMAVQPLVQEIQAKHKENPEKLQKEMMKLYKEHGFNPLAGCLPMLLPWPVLIALFFVFQNTIELRGVPFLWLPDLSAKDPFYILPILLAVSMFLMQWVSLRSLDTPNQQMKMMMYLMPPMMLFIFANLASGLNLYYATANLATIPQQVWIANERKKMKGRPVPKLSED